MEEMTKYTAFNIFDVFGFVTQQEFTTILLIVLYLNYGTFWKGYLDQDSSWLKNEDWTVPHVKAEGNLSALTVLVNTFMNT